jgi:solute carrier family 25 aspartate/glutamate transporter 12/13
MTTAANPLPVVHADSGDTNGGATSRVVQSVKSAVRAQESELKRWRRTFDANAKAVVNGEKYVPSVARTSPKLC